MILHGTHEAIESGVRAVLVREVLGTMANYWHRVKAEQVELGEPVAGDTSIDVYGVLETNVSTMARSLHPDVVDMLVELFVGAAATIDRHPDLVDDPPGPAIPFGRRREDRLAVMLDDEEASRRIHELEARMSRIETLLLGEGAAKYHALREVRADDVV